MERSMAKAKSISRNKTAKVPTKRSAPIQPIQPIQPPADQHINNWVNIDPAPSVLGGELLRQLKRAVGTHLILDEHGSPKRADRAYDAAETFNAALALAPPKAAIEALAAAILIYDDVDTAQNSTTDRARSDALTRIRQRASALASWIESTHRVDRCDWHLDFFCNSINDS
jgi:hypothetical protein